MTVLRLRWLQGRARSGALLVVGVALLPARGWAQADPASYYDFALYPTQGAQGASAEVRLRLAPSPFEIPTTVDGHVIYEVRIAARDLPASQDQEYVVWGAPPTLDTVERIGVLGADLTTSGRIHFNKFIVFITRSSPGDLAEPLGDPILLRGTSRSGRIRSIFDHTDIVGEDR